MTLNTIEVIDEGPMGFLFFPFSQAVVQIDVKNSHAMRSVRCRAGCRMMLSPFSPSTLAAISLTRAEASQSDFVMLDFEGATISGDGDDSLLLSTSESGYGKEVRWSRYIFPLYPAAPLRLFRYIE